METPRDARTKKMGKGKRGFNSDTKQKGANMTAEEKADFDFLLDRAMRCGSISVTRERETGITKEYTFYSKL